jgi:ribosomal protein S18 acetylase RimI-like enzyme
MGTRRSRDGFPAMTPPTIIEIAIPADAESILQLQRLAYQSEAELYQDWNIPPLTESLEELRAAFDRQVFLKALDAEQGRIVGSVRATLQDDICSIGRLIVHPQFQGKGIGSALMGRIELHFPQARHFELFTGHRSTRNILLYRRLGYVPFREQTLSAQLTLVFMRKSNS